MACDSAMFKGILRFCFIEKNIFNAVFVKLLAVEGMKVWGEGFGVCDEYDKSN